MWGWSLADGVAGKLQILPAMVHYGNETAENLDIYMDSGKANLKGRCGTRLGMLMIGYTMCKE